MADRDDIERLEAEISLLSDPADLTVLRQAVDQRLREVSPPPVVPAVAGTSEKVTPLTVATTCWQCGVAVVPGSKFCGGCGAKAGPVPCSGCGSVVAPHMKFCPDCGTAASV